MNDAACVKDELDVLRAVYGDENVRFEGSILCVTVSTDFVARLRIPQDYPSTSLPVVLPGGVGLPAVPESQMLMENLFERNEDVLLKWIEAVREATSEERQVKAERKAAEEESRIAAQQRRLVLAPQRTAESFEEVELDSSRFFTGSTIHANKSRFLGHAARCKSPEEAMSLVRLVRQSKYARATHNIWAYRLRNGRADNDDDGESAAGGRLAELLHLIDARDVLVVVSRYYGKQVMTRLQWFKQKLTTNETRWSQRRSSTIQIHPAGRQRCD